QKVLTREMIESKDATALIRAVKESGNFHTIVIVRCDHRALSGSGQFDGQKANQLRSRKAGQRRRNDGLRRGRNPELDHRQPSLAEAFVFYWCSKIEQKCRAAVSSTVDKD